MESEKPPFITTPEQQLLEASVDLGGAVKAEAFRKAELLGDEFVQLAELIGGRMPGAAIQQHIDLLKQIDFGTIAEFDVKVEECVGEAIRLSYIQLNKAVSEAIADTNRLLASMPGVFGIHGIENSTLVAVDIRPEEQQVLRLYLQTSGGVISLESAVLDIDFKKL